MPVPSVGPQSRLNMIKRRLRHLYREIAAGVDLIEIHRRRGETSDVISVNREVNQLRGERQELTADRDLLQEEVDQRAAAAAEAAHVEAVEAEQRRFSHLVSEGLRTLNPGTMAAAIRRATRTAGTRHGEYAGLTAEEVEVAQSQEYVADLERRKTPAYKALLEKKRASANGAYSL